MSFVLKIDEYARRSDSYRDVISTNKSQLVTMRLKPGEEIGAETHHDLDQDLYIVEGTGFAVLGGKKARIGPGDIVHVHSGSQHNVIGSDPDGLVLFTIYSTPEHAPGLLEDHKPNPEKHSI